MAQSYANHRRWSVLYHFVAQPLCLASLVMAIQAVRRGSPLAWWAVITALALVVVSTAARVMALTVQNRLIRLEERLRLARVLPVARHADIARLRTGQLIALRFAPDAELPALLDRVLAGEFDTPDAIKRAIRDWQPDELRA